MNNLRNLSYHSCLGFKLINFSTFWDQQLSSLCSGFHSICCYGVPWRRGGTFYMSDPIKTIQEQIFCMVNEPIMFYFQILLATKQLWGAGTASLCWFCWVFVFFLRHSTLFIYTTWWVTTSLLPAVGFDDSVRNQRWMTRTSKTASYLVCFQWFTVILWYPKDETINNVHLEVHTAVLEYK